jgi:hypothetical protein
VPKRDVGVAIGIGAASVVVGLFVPLPPITSVVFGWWPAPIALFIAGLLLGRMWPGPVARLMAGLGLAWLSIFAIVIALVLLAMLFIWTSGGLAGQ